MGLLFVVMGFPAWSRAALAVALLAGLSATAHQPATRPEPPMTRPEPAVPMSPPALRGSMPTGRSLTHAMHVEGSE